MFIEGNFYVLLVKCLYFYQNKASIFLPEKATDIFFPRVATYVIDLVLQRPTFFFFGWLGKSQVFLIAVSEVWKLNPNQMHESTWCLLMGYHSIITMAHVWGILELSSLLECSVMESVIFLVPNYIALVSLLFRFWCSSKIGVRLTIKALACGSLTGLLTCLIIDLPNTSIVELFYVNIPNKKRRFEY